MIHHFCNIFCQENLGDISNEVQVLRNAHVNNEDLGNSSKVDVNERSKEVVRFVFYSSINIHFHKHLFFFHSWLCCTKNTNFRGGSTGRQRWLPATTRYLVR